MGEDGGGRAHFAIDPIQRFEHDDPCFRIEGARGFVAEQHHRIFSDSACDRHPLLLPPR